MFCSFLSERDKQNKPPETDSSQVRQVVEETPDFLADALEISHPLQYLPILVAKNFWRLQSLAIAPNFTNSSIVK